MELDKAIKAVPRIKKVHFLEHRKIIEDDEPLPISNRRPPRKFRGHSIGRAMLYKRSKAEKHMKLDAALDFLCC